MNTTINATTREDQGKGASRRLRLAQRVPAIVYGTGKAPEAISLNIHEITHLLENEEMFTSVLDLTIDKKTQPIIIKDLQRHPAKNTIMHVDLLRVNLKQTIVTNIPLHFIGEENNEAIRLGAVLNQFITSIEISCLPTDLPNGIDIDISALELGEHISLTELNIPDGVTMTALTHGDIEAHNQSVAAVQEAKKMAEIEEDVPVVADDEEESTGEEDENAEESDGDAGDSNT